MAASLNSNPHHMRTYDVYDLENERRLSAVLDFSRDAAEFLVLNGGSHAEELTITFRIGTRTRSGAYCVDAGTSLRLVFPLLSNERASNVTLDVSGGPGPLVLRGPEPSRVPASRSLRMLAAVAATVLVMLVGTRTVDPAHLGDVALHATPAGRVASATQPFQPRSEPRIVMISLSPHFPATTSPQPRALARVAPVAFHHHRLPTHLPTARVARAARPARVYSPPEMRSLRVPAIVHSGDLVQVAYRALAKSVRIVASIGPTIVARRVVHGADGVVAIRPPKSDINSRVMTVRAYAQNGPLIDSREAMVVLVTPGE